MDLESHKERPLLFGILSVLVIIIVALLIYQLFLSQNSQTLSPVDHKAEALRLAEVPAPPLSAPPSEAERRARLADQPPARADISEEEYTKRQSLITEI